MRRAVVLAAVLASTPAFGRPPKPASAPPEAPKAVEAPTSPLDRLKALEGDWMFAGGDGAVASRWRVTSHGSAVTETLFPGTEHEMLTVYHLDGHDLVLTHYCGAGNQPRMRATVVDGPAFTFAFVDGTNLDPAKDGHMHDAVIRPDADGTLHETWSYWRDGVQTDTKSFDLVRKP